MRPGTPGFKGERLKAAREARCLSGAALAELTGISRSAISQYERSEQTPSPTVLQRIADALNVPPRHFLTDIPHVIAPVFYRSFASALVRIRTRAERRLEWLQEIIARLTQSVELPVPDVPDFGSDINVLALSGDDIDEVAARTRRAWGLGDGPISNLVRLAENHGIVIARQFLDTDLLDAFSYWPHRNTAPIVVLSSDKQCAVRSRFDLAHEIGHLVLHRNIQISQLCRPKDFKVIEMQANRYAAAFLLPSDSFLRELSSLSLDAFLALKQRWKVSVAVMVKRCENLGILDDDATQRLWINLGRRGWRKSEPLDDRIEVEAPSMLTKSFELLKAEVPEAFRILIEQLPWARSEIESIVGLPDGFLEERSMDIGDVVPRILRFPDAT